MRYGIPDFKMEKHLIDRRVEQLETEGVTFHYNTNVGVDMPAKQLAEDHDALIICGGSEVPRDLPVEGRGLDGVHFAMDFLPQQNRRVGQNRSAISRLFSPKTNTLLLLAAATPAPTALAQASVRARRQ